MSSKIYKNRYTASEFLRLGYSFVLTKLFWNRAKLICYPVSMRGKKSFEYGVGFSCGYNCRFDLLNTERKTLFIGKNCQLNDNCHIVAIDKVEIGDNFLCASKVFISDTSHGSYSIDGNCDNPLSIPKDRELVSKPVIIGNNVWVGENVVILPGSQIGDGSIIGANSVVTKSIPPFSIAAGNPARLIKQYDFIEKRWRRV